MTLPTPPEDAAEERPSARRGRPRLGVAVVTRLSEAEQAQALSLGDGKLALGLRRSVQLGALLGMPAARRLLGLSGTQPPETHDE